MEIRRVDINASTGVEGGIFIAKALTTSRSEITATGCRRLD